MNIVILSNKRKFPLGQLVITANAQAQLKQDDVEAAIMRHMAGDWGNVSPDGAQANEEGLWYSNRLLSIYGRGDQTFWIITNGDRSKTTVLMPEDY